MLIVGRAAAAPLRDEQRQVVRVIGQRMRRLGRQRRRPREHRRPDLGQRDPDAGPEGHQHGPHAVIRHRDLHSPGRPHGMLSR